MPPLEQPAPQPFNAEDEFTPEQWENLAENLFNMTRWTLENDPNVKSHLAIEVAELYLLSPERLEQASQLSMEDLVKLALWADPQWIAVAEERIWPMGLMGKFLPGDFREGCRRKHNAFFHSQLHPDESQRIIATSTLLFMSIFVPDMKAAKSMMIEGWPQALERFRTNMHPSQLALRDAMVNAERAQEPQSELHLCPVPGPKKMIIISTESPPYTLGDDTAMCEALAYPETVVSQALETTKQAMEMRLVAVILGQEYSAELTGSNAYQFVIERAREVLQLIKTRYTENDAEILRSLGAGLTFLTCPNVTVHNGNISLHREEILS